MSNKRNLAQYPKKKKKNKEEMKNFNRDEERDQEIVIKIERSILRYRLQPDKWSTPPIGWWGGLETVIRLYSVPWNAEVFRANA